MINIYRLNNPPKEKYFDLIYNCMQEIDKGMFTKEDLEALYEKDFSLHLCKENDKIISFFITYNKENMFYLCYTYTNNGFFSKKTLYRLLKWNIKRLGDKFVLLENTAYNKEHYQWFNKIKEKVYG